MNILIIEDDQNKIKQLCEFIHRILPSNNIIVKNSYQSGVRELINHLIDCLVLDMTLPTFDRTPFESGGRIRIYGGKDVLRQIDRKKIQIPVIVVTQFESFGPSDNKLSLQQLGQELKSAHPHTFKGIIYYNTTLNNWQNELESLLLKIKDEQRGNSDD